MSEIVESLYLNRYIETIVVLDLWVVTRFHYSARQYCLVLHLRVSSTFLSLFEIGRFRLQQTIGMKPVCIAGWYSFVSAFCSCTSNDTNSTLCTIYEEAARIHNRIRSLPTVPSLIRGGIKELHARVITAEFNVPHSTIHIFVRCTSY